MRTPIFSQQGTRPPSCTSTLASMLTLTGGKAWRVPSRATGARSRCSHARSAGIVAKLSSWRLGRVSFCRCTGGPSCPSNSTGVSCEFATGSHSKHTHKRRGGGIGSSARAIALTSHAHARDSRAAPGRVLVQRNPRPARGALALSGHTVVAAALRRFERPTAADLQGMGCAASLASEESPGRSRVSTPAGRRPASCRM
eukprot:366519-Chlamydomonas_euryale.AAC.13